MKKNNIQKGDLVVVRNNKLYLAQANSPHAVGVASRPMQAGAPITNATASSIVGTSTTASTVTVDTSIRKKQVMKCSECGKKICEYYASYPLGSTFFGDEIPKDPLCKTCHQIEKLRE